MATLTTEQWCDKRDRLIAMARESESCLTVREAATKLRVRQQTVVDMVDEAEWLDLIIGCKQRGGYSVCDRMGDYQIEVMDGP